MAKTFNYIRIYEINNRLVAGSTIENAINLFKNKYENEEVESIRVIKDSGLDRSSLVLYSVNEG